MFLRFSFGFQFFRLPIRNEHLLSDSSPNIFIVPAEIFIISKILIRTEQRAISFNFQLGWFVCKFLSFFFDFVVVVVVAAAVAAAAAPVVVVVWLILSFKWYKVDNNA